MEKEIEKYSEKLILFAYHEIVDNGHYRNIEWFNFEFSKTEKFISNHPDETKPDGKSLINFKKKTKLINDELIRKALTKNINENFFERRTINGEFCNLEFTEKGMRLAKAILLNKKESKKKLITYPLEKIIIPIVVASLIALITSYITTEYQNDKVNKKIENLEKEIKWLK